MDGGGVPVTRQTAAVTCQVIKDLLKNDEFVTLMETIVSNAVEKKLGELLNRLAVVEGDVFDLQQKLKKKDTEISKLNMTIENMSREVQSANNSINNLEQYSRRSCIRIFGVEENPGEDTDAIVAEIIRDQVGVSLESRDIDRSHRTGKMPKPSSAATPGKPPRHRAIIVKLSSYKKRRDILGNRKNLKGTGMSIVEDLTMKNQALLAKTRNTSKILAAWTVDGRVIALLPASGGKTVKKVIRNEDDLLNI